MNKIIILHLSDIHFKKKIDEENKNFRQEVQKKSIDRKETLQKTWQPGFCGIYRGHCLFRETGFMN